MVEGSGPQSTARYGITFWCGTALVKVLLLSMLLFAADLSSKESWAVAFAALCPKGSAPPFSGNFALLHNS